MRARMLLVVGHLCLVRAYLIERRAERRAALWRGRAEKFFRRLAGGAR